jgi:hypothetical protein
MYEASLLFGQKYTCTALRCVVTWVCPVQTRSSATRDCCKLVLAADSVCRVDQWYPMSMQRCVLQLYVIRCQRNWLATKLIGVTFTQHAWGASFLYPA